MHPKYLATGSSKQTATLAVSKGMKTPSDRTFTNSLRLTFVRSEWQAAPSGENQQSKLEILSKEKVYFDDKGMLLDKKQLWADFNEA